MKQPIKVNVQKWFDKYAPHTTEEEREYSLYNLIEILETDFKDVDESLWDCDDQANLKADLITLIDDMQQEEKRDISYGELAWLEDQSTEELQEMLSDLEFREEKHELTQLDESYKVNITSILAGREEKIEDEKDFVISFRVSVKEEGIEALKKAVDHHIERLLDLESWDEITSVYSATIKEA